jgi:hypothetical protein
MFGKYNGFVSKARVSSCMYFLVCTGLKFDSGVELSPGLYYRQG